ncbi:MAG: hypothetical protein ACO1OX_05090 [Novosphingobium sp.]
MFDLAAVSQPTAAPALQAAPLQNGGNAAVPVESAAAAPALAFDALLALQIAPAEPADAPLPESGKILPDAAKLFAGLPQARPAEEPVRPQAAKARATAEPGEDDFTDAPELPDVALPDAALPDAALPDAAFIAALFAAPDRLTVAEVEDASAQAKDLRAAASLATPATNAPHSSAQAAIALASTAQIELTSAPEAAPAPVMPEAVATTPTAQIMAARQVRQNRPVEADAEASEVPARPSSLALARPPADGDQTETPRVEATSTINQLADRSVATADMAAPASVRHEARAERIDFATLVENVARAREEASPRAVTASINHAEFGRVTLRFDQSENEGMAVAMSSADPGFARAVSATTEAARTPAESTAQNPQTQSEARSQTSQGESQRQQPRQAEQAPARQFSGNSASASEDSTPRHRSDDRGIYA